MLCNEIHENIQDKLKLWKESKQKYESFKLKVEPHVIVDLFDALDSAIQFSKAGSSYVFKTQYTDLKVSKISKRTNMIEVVEPEVEKLKPFFGNDFCSFPFKHPNEGAVGQNNLMVRIPAINSNVSFTYDILLKELKVRFPVKLEAIVAFNQVQHSLSDQLSLIKEAVMDKQFFDELRDLQVNIVKAEIISTKKINGAGHNTKNDIVIYGYVNDANVLKTDPSLEYKTKTCL